MHARTSQLFATLACLLTLALAGCGGGGASSTATSVGASEAAGGASGESTSSAGASGARDDEAESAEAEAESDEHSEDTVRPNVADRDKTKTPDPGSGTMVTVGAFDALYSTIDGEVSTTSTKAVVAQNQDAYDKLIAKQFGSSTGADSRLKVDFAGGEQVIAVYAPESKRGSRIEVDKVLTNGSRTEVRATLYVPPHDCAESTGHAYVPAQWVVTRKLPAKTSVTVRRQSISC